MEYYSTMKRKTTGSCNNCGKPDTSVHAPWFHLYENLEFAKLVYGDRKQISGCLGPVVGGNILGTMEMFCILIVVVVT